MTADIPTRTLRSELYQSLREGPKTREELSNAPTSPHLRDLVCRLKYTVPSGGDRRKSRGQALTVYYLWGDDRRGVRKFIDVNEEFVASCMADNAGPLRQAWDDALASLIEEEWAYRTRGQTGPAGEDLEVMG